MTLLFLAFSVLMGMSLSFVLLVYTGASVFKTFAVTSAMFGVMAVLGYTTKTDLTKFGSILIMAVIGLVIAMVINMFMHSSMMEYIISVGSGIDGNVQGADVRKMSIMGALTLYLDFINLFLFLLRFLGNRK
jgi:FtsH-binding integral membrane protein